MTRLFLRASGVALGVLFAVPACSTTTVVTTMTGDGGGSVEDGGAPQDSGGGQCTAARAQLLVPVAKVSTAEVKLVSSADGVTTIYVDASAGGFDQARKSPRVYITLAGARVDVSDEDAPTSSAWDLALKRQVLFTNGGDTGPGKGGGAIVEKDFDTVTAADAISTPPALESLFDEECNAKKDQIGDPQTSFTGWYDYDPSTMKASARAGVSFIVKSAAGVLHKVGIVSYTGKPDGTTSSPATGFFLLKVSPL
jgi:hypothetical protein